METLEKDVKYVQSHINEVILLFLLLTSLNIFDTFI